MLLGLRGSMSGMFCWVEVPRCKERGGEMFGWRRWWDRVVMGRIL